MKVVASNEVPADQFMMMTWHDDEPLAEVFGSAAFTANHPTVPLEQIVIIDIGPTNREAELLHDYAVAQILSDGMSATGRLRSQSPRPRADVRPEVGVPSFRQVPSPVM